MRQDYTDLFAYPPPPSLPPGALMDLAEAAVTTGQWGEACVCAKQSVQSAHEDAVLLWRGAAVFAACQRFGEAVDCVNRVAQAAALRPDQEAFYAGCLFHLGERAEAADAYRRALAAEPDNLDYAISGSVALMEAGQLREAVALLLTMRRVGRGHAGYLLQLAGALNAVRRASSAIRVARAGIALSAEESWDGRLLLANILSECGRHSDALGELADRGQTVPPHVYFVRSVIQQRLGENEVALADIDLAVAQRPEDRGYLAHRGAILSALARFHESAEVYRGLYAANPADTHMARAYFGALVEAGDFEVAIPIGARIVVEHPGDEPLLDALKGIIERQARRNFSREMNDANSRLAERFGPPPAVVQRNGGVLKANPLVLQWRVIGALLLRETRTRFGKSRLGYAWVMFEPLVHVGIMVSLVTLLSHNGMPPIGPNFTMFYFTGIIPYHMVTHTIAHVMKAIPENRPMLQLPIVKSLDVYMARGLLEIATEFIVALLLLFFFSFFGLATLPINIAGVIEAMFLLWVFAMGLGILFSIFAHHFPGWERIWGMVASLIYFSSGIFYVARGMPEWIRDILVWNPVLQGIEMIRVNYFHEIYPFWMDVGYLVRGAIVALAVGLGAERLYRRRLLEVE